jgi:PAS domain S-box-containing protein
VSEAINKERGHLIGVHFTFKGLRMKMNRKIAADDNSAIGTNDNRIHNLLGGETEPSTAAGTESLLSGGGEMGERIRAFDWPKSPLGPVDSWSPALLTTVRILLANRFPILLLWGPDYISIYNDAYIPILGKKHPWALGRSVREVWKEIWHILQPLFDTPFHGGPPTWDDDIMLEMNRYGFTEETHFTIAYSPVPDESAPNGIGGILATVNEITEKVIGERRIVTLRDLGARVGDARTAEEACLMAAETLTSHAREIPFALLYLIDEHGKQARLAGAAGIPANEEISPLVVDLDSRTETGWPLAAVKRTEQMRVVKNLGEHFASLPTGPWSDPPNTAAVVPIPSNKAHEPAGLMVAGVSARLKYDQLYKDFIELVRTQVATAIANARAYEEERHRVESLAEIDRAKIAFFSNVSHEFRTPLTLMLGPLEDVLSQNTLATEDRERLDLVHRNALRQLKLVNTLLDFSRIEAGRIEASFESVDLAAYTADLASVFRSAIEHAGLRLVVDCPPLPGPVYVDREMWEKIILNLLSNAFKFTFEGEIAVSLRQSGETVQLVVRDTGVGIPAQELPHMFERFHRIREARSRTHEGTGIGLALVQELVHLHGGTIEVSSIENQGTTFTISIPTGTTHLPADRIRVRRHMNSATRGADPFVEEVLSWLPEGNGPLAEVDQSQSGTGEALADRGNRQVRETRSGKARILLADDNSDMRRYIERLLEEQQYEIEAVSNGQAALRAARDHTPDLVLTDVMIPGLDGFELLRELRQSPATATVPVIMLSARAGEESRVEGMEAGADDYLIKPFSARELIARVRAHLEIAHNRRDAEKAIQYRSAQFETLLNQAPIGVYLVDADFRILEMNPTARAVFGDIGDLTGRDFDEVIHLLWNRNYADEIVMIFRHTLETGEPYATPERSEYRIDRQMNEYYEWRLDRILLPDGRFGVVCYFRDIADEVRARLTIAESEERYRGIFNQSVGAIVEADPTGRFITVNDHMCEMTGYSREELLNLKMQDLTHPEDLLRSRELLDKLARGGEPYEIEKRYIRKDGSVIWVHKSASAIRDPGDKTVRSLIAVLIDITKSKQTEIALQQLNLQLENLVQDRTTELRDANQSLREEITGRIKVEQELNLSRDRLRQLSRRLVEVQEEERRIIAQELHDRAGQTLSALSINLTILKDQLLEDTRRKVGTRLSDSIELTTDVINVIRNVVSDLRPMALDDYGLQATLKSYIADYVTRYGIQVQLDQPEVNIPQLEPGVAMTVVRIVQEALTNVVRHAQASHVRVSIRLVNDVLHLTIDDNGVGIANTQHRSASHGLKIMRERAEAFGGSANVGMAPKKGTRVEARIPIHTDVVMARTQELNHPV